MTSRFFDALLSHPEPPRREVVFRGRNRHDTQRAALRYWAENEANLGIQFREFRRQCAWANEDTIVFEKRPRV